MELMRCKMCGGTVTVNQEQGTVTCDYCGLTMIVPKASDDRLANLLERAGGLRERGEFDKALVIYEIVLAESPRDSAAHWGALLSKYGIEYVEDPITHTPTPTCHRAQYESILADADYQNALEFATDESERLEFEQEARRIAEIQKGILAVSRQEAPYDVFICYKEQSEAGTRTSDSVLAQDIYYQLSEDGYRVFFARITLEDRLGTEYEPYIFAALNSAKVMVVVGTRPEYFNAVWVRNEWSRFLAITRKDRSHLLIPCYKDMNPYDLPEELSMLQSQDMGKIGFLQDLLRGIKKIVANDADGTLAPKEATSEKKETSVPPLLEIGPALKEVGGLIANGEFVDARTLLFKILRQDRMCARAYFYKFMVDNACRSTLELRQKATPEWFRQPDFTKALVLAKGDELDEFHGYIITEDSEVARNDDGSSAKDEDLFGDDKSFLGIVEEKTVLQWFFAVYRKYGTFKGRARRKEYWSFFFINMLVYLPIMLLDSAVYGPEYYYYGPFYVIYSIFSIIPGLAVMTRRLHDRGHSGWLWMINLLPFVGWLIFFVVLCSDSLPEPNRYGHSPKYA